MKHYQVRQVQPSTNQFYQIVRDNLTEQGAASASYQIVLHLFQVSEGFYKTLDSHTGERLAIFTESGQYLTATQEHDLVSLTAHYIQGMDILWVSTAIDNDPIPEADKAVLHQALDLFKTTAEASRSALGRPAWIEPS
ncbi:MAG: hypothetical protein HC851_22310 [Acaryochloris sp. RU_4_1]|nr:hypothetical protein [Acaryochloris sp. RU_4_1]NJR57129.1 hypothetical protein [Acaryochloris sp. CRU_2_0]